MNYRHAYHAGNIPDVVKHVVLIALLERLKAKPGAFLYLDTHAGVGRYDLASVEAGKTQEAEAGVLKLLASPAIDPALAPYLDVVKAEAGPSGKFYPGSPAIARRLLREQDRAVLAELHPDDADSLRAVFRRDRQVAVHCRDGYEAMKAFLPPTERRGLVLIDPPFEDREEFRALVDGMTLAHRRWPTGIYAIWYPIKDRGPVDRFHAAMQGVGWQKLLLVEFLVDGTYAPERLNGSGLLIVNPPWQIEDELKPALAAIATGLHLEDAVIGVEMLADGN